MLCEPKLQRSISQPIMRSTLRTAAAKSGSKTPAKLKAQTTEVTALAKSCDAPFHTTDVRASTLATSYGAPNWQVAWYPWICRKTSRDREDTVVVTNCAAIA